MSRIFGKDQFLPHPGTGKKIFHEYVKVQSIILLPQTFHQAAVWAVVSEVEPEVTLPITTLTPEEHRLKISLYS